jgi:nucleoid-associated protein YgaU
MNATLLGRMTLPCLVVLAGAAVLFEVIYMRERPPEIGLSSAGPAISLQASVANRDEGAVTITTKQAEATAEALVSAVSPSPTESDESLAAFDVARVDRTGDAVIAGRAAPGAIVELLRGGELYDRAVANEAGEFIMVPPRLPSGKHELTLRSRQPDGKQASSKQKVMVAVSETEPNHSPAESAWDQLPTKQNIASQLSNAAAATPKGNLPSALGKTTHTMVSHGDSLWSISRAAYGAGLRYAIIYNANHNLIRNPNRIFPGQTLILPK